MFVRPPFRELREVLEYFSGVSVKYVRPVLVYKNPVLVVLVKGITSNVRSPVDELQILVARARKPYCNDTSCETCPYTRRIKHETSPSPRLPWCPADLIGSWWFCV